MNKGQRGSGVRRLAIAGGLASLAMVVMCGDAWARPEVCNNTGAQISVAIAYQDKGPAGVSTGGHSGVVAEGYWSFAPGECAKISDVDTAQNWVWYHAHGQGRTWGGNSRLCLQSKPFTVRTTFLLRDEGCRPPTSARGFGRIDTDKRNFKLTMH